MLVNTNTPRAEAVQQTVARAALGLERPVPIDLRLSAEERAKYVCSYDLGPIQVRVFEDAEHLILKPSGQTAARLLFQGDGTFLANVAGDVRFEFRVESGRASALTSYRGSQQLEGQGIEG